MDQLMQSITVIVTGILGVALLSVIVSRNANTAGVLQAGGSAFSGMLGTAISPVTGGSGNGWDGFNLRAPNIQWP
jgi:hypothetical protein